ncbi:hypothetical protein YASMINEVIRUS_529 [Yasminevirus sp. GU-2018]|uniref:Tryptophan-rich sensory protein n=1 Tax=Yasminevirus sp. GU-2018 TaxID=2420051 RepID=A0A5K0UAE6_9VIRU|nr:hypothetical protein YASMINEVIRUS_529 [Yasminevirus sp. GU-2018]
MLELWTVIVNAVVLFVTLIGNGLVSSLSSNNIGVVSNKYQLPITPVGWTFSIWGLIYLQQIVLCILTFLGYYGVVNTDAGVLALNNVSLICLAVANVFNFLWLFAFVNERLTISLFLILALLISLVVGIFFNSGVDVPFSWPAWVICFYAGWVFVATLLNFFIVLRYDIPVGSVVVVDMISTYAVFSTVFFVILLWIMWSTNFFNFSDLSVVNWSNFGVIPSMLWAVIGAIVKLVSP